MDVRCPPVHAIQHDLINEPHHGGIVHIGIGKVRVTAFVNQMEPLRIEVGKVESGDGSILRPDGAGDARVQLVMFHDYRFHVQGSLKLDVIQRLDIGRIRDAHEKASASAHQRQNPVLREQFRWNQGGRLRFRLHGIQVQRRNTEFTSRRHRDAAGVAAAGRHQAGDQGRGLFP